MHIAIIKINNKLSSKEKIELRDKKSEFCFFTPVL